MTDQECTEPTAPFLSFNHWTQACWVCVCVCVCVCVRVCVCECVNALLRLPEFICLVSCRATPFSNFFCSIHATLSPHSSLRLFRSVSFSRRKLTKTRCLHSWIYSMNSLMNGKHIIILEEVLSAAFTLDSAVLTDVAQKHARAHTEPVLPPFPLSWR